MAVRRRPKSVGAGLATAYRLFARSVCDVQRCCSCSCCLWRYISVMPLPFLKMLCLYYCRVEYIDRNSWYASCFDVFNLENLQSPLRISYYTFLRRIYNVQIIRLRDSSAGLMKSSESYQYFFKFRFTKQGNVLLYSSTQNVPSL